MDGGQAPPDLAGRSGTPKPTSIGQPAYMVESLHKALVLLNAIRDQGPMRLRDAANEIGVAESTAHRLLSTLAYHGFVERDINKRFRPGPALGIGPADSRWARSLHDACLPEMAHLAEATGETVNLLVRTGTRVRVIASVESTRLLRAGSRQGHVPPAHSAAGGRALLAELTDDEVRALYSTASEADRLSRSCLDDLLIKLQSTRRSGYALASDEVEAGLSAVGTVIRNGQREAVGALVVALPTLRLKQSLDDGLRLLIQNAVDALAPQLVSVQPPKVS